MMDSKTEQSRANYNKIAGNYDDTFDGRFTRKFKAMLVDAVKLEKGFRVLDVACANGLLLHNLSLKEDIEGYGVDISEKMIHTARERHPRFTFEVAGSDSLPFQDKYFDVITVSAAFHHFSQPERFMLEAKRVLKDGGTLYIAELYMPPLIRQGVNSVLPFLKMGDVKIYTGKELMVFASNAGYKEITIVRKENVNLFKGTV
jgi:ubiquinone/menaquinone biosynthesis C-methylase UbiE